MQRDYGVALNGFFLVFSESRNSKTDQEIKLIPVLAGTHAFFGYLNVVLDISTRHAP
ncbi:hypothetical protein HER14_19445 [Acidithiobacillus thiooxidans]|uniref:Uncharacterized protein n=1 Tax=Acidithiobacillus thiooxidans ATCC 19377 TaxID=637390 RepID=A0A5P9XQ58_ACITH|nr:hypothetical protein [Acidithiobacillus thiooxidans]MBU2753041.1 hypothetical protein [Acidithiobacillus thiooxidans]QFX96151.1 hypothetical protein GCD22_01876 [Acidithiobacillus thiooxidans ATCC 19377]